MGIEHAIPPGDRDDGEEEARNLALKFQRENNPHEGKPILERLARGARIIEQGCAHRVWWRAAAFPRVRRSPYNREDFREWARRVEFYLSLMDEAGQADADPLRDRLQASIDGLLWPELDKCGVAFPIKVGKAYAGALPAWADGVVWLGDREALVRVQQAGQLAIFSNELTEFAGLHAVEPETFPEVWRAFWKVRGTLGNGDGKPFPDTLFESLPDDMHKGETEKVST